MQTASSFQDLFQCVTEHLSRYKVISGHVVEVLRDRWAVISLNAPASSTDEFFGEAMQSAEAVLRQLWTKGVCRPKSFPETRDMERVHCASFWIPLQECTSRDFEAFYSAKQPTFR